MALKARGLNTLVLGGGVAANSLLRAEAMRRGREAGIAVYLPPPVLCTDNAVMIALVAQERLAKGQQSSLILGPQPGAMAMDADQAIIGALTSS